MKKCLVLDLDNTLWGGIVGEDGIDNLALSLTPPGNGFLAFQQAILDHYDRGIILAINSRNNPDEAWNVIRTHPNMILKEHHFAAARMNWNDKAENLRELAKELNIGLDSMVFLDDDPTNRELVRAILPEVLVPELPDDPSRYARFLNSLGVFESAAITDEDKMRGNLYVTERLRREEEKTAQSKEEFLAGLGLELTVYMDDASALDRLAQLTEKTNQFNVLKRPYTAEELKTFVDKPDRHVIYARLQDKFGDYGIIALAIIEQQGETWHLSTLLMSCRVFGRGVEDAFLASIAELARAAGARYLTIAFEETEKNLPAREFVERRFGERRSMAADAATMPVWLNSTYEKL